ncbi:MAG: ECF-type sigma factor [Planctomycetota bacterium]
MDAEPPNPSHDATLLLNLAQGGDHVASEQLMQLVYEQLRATAGSYFRAQSADHTLQPTALVHEAYIKLMGAPGKEWESRDHFCAVASIAMRHILRDHARMKRAAKRGGKNQRELLTVIESPSGASAVDLLQLDEVLTELTETDERGARIVEMRYFGGMTNEEIARVLGVSTRTVERSSRRSLAWIRSEMSGNDEANEFGPGENA